MTNMADEIDQWIFGADPGIEGIQLLSRAAQALRAMHAAGTELVLVVDETGHYVADEDTPGFRRCVECDFPSSDSINAWDQHDEGCSIYDRRRAVEKWHAALQPQEEKSHG